MTMHSDLIDKSHLTPDMRAIAGKVISNRRITREEGILLFEKASPGLLGILAGHAAERKNGRKAYFIRNYHIEPTNICVHNCRFCSYSARQTGHAWEHSPAEIAGMVEALEPNIRELHITGGVHPSRDLTYYGELLKTIKHIRPDIHVKAYSAIELDYMITKAGMNYEEGLSYLRECGLDSIPGGGAEIFDERLRMQICADKTTSENWLRIHETAHNLGIITNATMLYGHIETYAHRIDHLERLRKLQDKTAGFNAFIPLKFRNKNNELAGVAESSVVDDLKTYAVSRLFLDNFPHIKAYWPAIGKQTAQLTLSFGVDDLDGTINDSTKIYSLAGAGEQNPTMSAEEMKELILQTGKIPMERDAWYREIY